MATGFFTGLLNRGSSSQQPAAPAGTPSQQPQQQGPGNGPGSSMQLNGGQQPQQQQQPNNQGASNFVLPNNQQPNQNNNSGGAQPNGNANVSPLDKFNNIWQNPTQNGQPQVDPFSQPLLNADPAKIAEAARSHDFKQSIPQELLQKAMSGDAQSMIEIINNVGQQALTVAAQLSTATAEFAGKNVQQRFDQVFPDRFRKHQLGAIKPSNPVLEHPNAQPMLRMLREQAAANNPTWSPDQVAKWAEDYLMEFSGQLSPQQQPQQQSGNGGAGNSQDWDEWVGSNAGGPGNF